MWGGEWFASTNPLPVGTNGQPCTTNANCASNICNATSGKCYPTYSQFATEVNNAAAHFSAVDDGIVFVAMPPAIPWPGNWRHDAVTRTGHPTIAYVEAPYTTSVTIGAEHEIAEAITDPRYRFEGAGWIDDCGCELVDVCDKLPSPPPPLSVGESRVNHDVITLFSNDTAGNCVYAYSQHKDYYFVDVSSGNVMHTTCLWCSYAFDNYLKPPGGVTLTSTPGAVSWSNGRQDAFVYGSDGNVWQWRQGPGISPAWWNGFGHPSGTLKYAPDAFSWRPLQEDVVVVSQNTSGVNELWARRYDNGMNGWRNLGAPPVSTIASRPGSASWGPTRFDIFFRTTESPPHVRHAWSDNGTTVDGWDDWGYPPGVTLVAGPDAASWGDHRVDVVALGNDGNVWQTAWDHGTGYGWYSWGHPSVGAFYYAPTAVGQGDGRLDVAASTLQIIGGSSVRQAYRQIWKWSGFESTWDQNYDAQYEQGTYIDSSFW